MYYVHERFIKIICSEKFVQFKTQSTRYDIIYKLSTTFKLKLNKN